MRFSRIGESLWSEWDGYDFPQEDPDSIVYFTLGWVDIDQPVVRRALASTIQRDGTAESMGEAYEVLDTAEATQAHAAHVGGDDWFTYFETEDTQEEDTDTPVFATWVEITRGN